MGASNIRYQRCRSGNAEIQEVKLGAVCVAAALLRRCDSGIQMVDGRSLIQQNGDRLNQGLAILIVCRVTPRRNADDGVVRLPWLQESRS